MILSYYVSMAKPLTVNNDYPTTDGICPDAYSLTVISPAYATSTGELNAILQYVYQSFIFAKQRMQQISDTLEGIAVAEMIHLKLLGNTIAALGAQPIFCQYPPMGYNFYSTKFVSYSRNPVNMIEDDIMGEKHAICQYSKMLTRLKNEQVKAIISCIVEDEKLHLETLNEILNKLKC